MNEMAIPQAALTMNPPRYQSKYWLGAGREFQEDVLGTIERIGAVGPLVDVALFLGKRAIFPTDPAVVREVLVTHGSKYSKETLGYKRMRMVMGNGLVTSNGDFWKRQRRIAQPAFAKPRIEALAERMAAAASDLAAEWARHRGDERDISRDMMHVTLRIVGDTLLSRDVTRASDQIGDAVTVALEFLIHSILRPFAMPRFVPTKRNREFKKALDTLDRVVGGIIEARRRGESHGEGDLLDMLMASKDDQTGEEMSDEQLRDEVMTIFLAGHETTAMALTWTFYLLAQHPEIEQRVRAEVLTIPTDRNIRVSDLAALDLTGRVIQEAMRIYPPVYLIGRSCIEPHDLPGVHVKKGDWLFLCQWLTHRSPDVWPDPLKFDPDRFLKDRFAQMPPMAYYPFAAGGRKCIGDHFAQMEAKIILATLMRNTHLVLRPGFKPTLQPLVTLRPLEGMPMRIEAA